MLLYIILAVILSILALAAFLMLAAYTLMLLSHRK